MKKIIWLSVYIVLTSLCFIFNANAQTQKTIYLNKEQENLRLSPKGTIIGQLNKGVELYEMERQGKWIKVAVTGWIWEPSTTENKNEALGPKSRASIIMVEFKTDAEEILAQLKAGQQTFEELAKLKSIHPTAQQGGDLGFFRQGDFDPKFEKEIFSLQPDQISGIVELEFNNKTYYCIFKRVQ